MAVGFFSDCSVQEGNWLPFLDGAQAASHASRGGGASGAMAVVQILLLSVVAAALLILVSSLQLLDWVPDILTSSPAPSPLDNTLFQPNPTSTTTYTPSSHAPPCLVPSWFWRAHRRDAIADISAPSWGPCQTDLCIFIGRLVFRAEGHQLRVPSAIRC